MDGSIPTTADAALEQAFDAAIEREKMEPGEAPNLGRVLGERDFRMDPDGYITTFPVGAEPPRKSTADPQAFPQAPEPEQTLSSEEIALDTINRQLENERARCASILKSIFAFRQEYSSRRKTISALEIAAEKLAEGG